MLPSSTEWIGATLGVRASYMVVVPTLAACSQSPSPADGTDTNNDAYEATVSHAQHVRAIRQEVGP